MEAIRRRPRFTTGCPVLDRVLDGGFPCGAITELFGESTAAKTQLTIQLLVTVQFPAALGGLDGSSIYIHTEGYFPGRRLRQIAAALRESMALGFDPLANVFVESAGSVSELFSLLDRLEELIERRRREDTAPVRLIAIDSMAAIFRSEFENNKTEMAMRATNLFQVAASLKKLAHRYDLAVVVTNQVMDQIDGSSGSSMLQVGNLKELVSSRRKVAPALGLAWGHCINVRIFLSRSQEEIVVDHHQEYKRPRLDRSGCCYPIGQEGTIEARSRSRTKREFHVLFAPHLPYRSCEFVVDQSGVHGLVVPEERETA